MVALCRALLALWTSVTALVNVELLQLALEVVRYKTLESQNRDWRSGAGPVGEGTGGGSKTK